MCGLIVTLVGKPGKSAPKTQHSQKFLSGKIDPGHFIVVFSYRGVGYKTETRCGYNTGGY